MKKRLIAVLCLLALVIGIFAITATAADTQDQAQFDVGYAKINITPYVWYAEDTEQYAKAADEAKFTAGGVNYCYSDSDGDGVYDVLHLPQRGSGSVWNRPGTTVIDDNGDGVVDLNDGLFITCMSVTDSNDKTILFVSIDLIGSDEIDAMRTAAASRLSGKVTSDSIFYAGTHTHTAPDLAVRGDKEGDTNFCVDTFANPDETHTFTYDDMNTDLETWYEHLKIAMADVAEQAYNSRAAATVTRGEIEANGENTGNRTMVTTRHYVSTDSNDEEYYNGDNFNPRANGSADAPDNVKQVTQVDETLYMLQFTFKNGNDPIAFTNWRGHPSLNNSASYNGNRNAYSSDFINPYRYELSKKENGGYRVIYFNGTGGNTNPRGYEWNTAFTQAANGDSYSTGTIDYWWIDNEKTLGADGTYSYQGRAITYGRKLADVALKCLENNMSPVTGGDEIRTYQYSLLADRQEFSDLAYYACQAAQTYYAAGESGVFQYPSAVTNEAKITETQYNSIRNWAQNKGSSSLDNFAQRTLTWNGYLPEYTYIAKEQFYIYAAEENLDLAKADAIVATADSYASSGEYYNVASKFHANSVVGKWIPTADGVAGHLRATTKASMELNAFVLGDNLAFVTAPGEPFDYYDANGSTAAADNDWLELINEDTYGTPFILGYCNGAVGYIPNTKAYSYNKGSKTYAVGCYESQSTAFAQGSGEEMVAQLKRMLTAVSAEDFYYTAECEHCGVDVQWIPYAGTGDQSGHYYLLEDMDAAQVIIKSDVKICLDLNGKTFTGDRRAFFFEGPSGELNIMDSSTDETGAVVGVAASKGAGSGWGGGTVMVATGCELNLYGGTLRFEQQEGYSTANGGVIGVRGTVNLYGGTVEGGVATAHINSEGKIGHTAHGGSIHVYNDTKGTGTLNIYGGTIEDGSLEAYKEDDAGTWTKIDVAKGYAYGSCVCVASDAKVNLYGTEASSSVAEIYFMGSPASSLTVHGDYRGTANLTQKDTTFKIDAVVGKTATYNGVAADVSLGNITVGDYYAAVKGSDLVVAPTQYTYGYCEACEADKQWTPLNDAAADGMGNSIADGHYRVTETISTVQKNVASGAKVCLDLNGCTYTGASRAFYTSANTNATLNIMDSSAAQTGRLVGSGGSNGAKSGFGGGTLFMAAGTELNIYSGTFGFKEKTGYSTYAGGVVFTRGTVNMYGGTIEGGTVTSYKGPYTNSSGTTSNPDRIGRGGAICVDGGTLTLSGGVITAGTGAIHADSSGETAPYALCVYITAKAESLALSNDVNINEIYFESSSANVLTVNGSFSGSVNLSYPDSIQLSGGTVVGKCTNGATITGTITVNGDSDRTAMADGENLVLAVTEKDIAQIVTSTGNVTGTYDSVQEAIDAYTTTDGDAENPVYNFIRLQGETVKPITVNKEVYIDLAGHNIRGAVTVEEGYTLYGMDSATDDYTVEDGVYGKLTGGVSGDVQGVPVDTVSAMEDADNANYHRAGYLKVTEDSGVSFHRLNLQLTKANLDTDIVGFYYTGAFMADEVVAGKVKSFGVALSVVDVPNAENLVADCARSTFNIADGYTLDGQKHGTKLQGVMLTENSISTNRRNAAMTIYGNAYVELTDNAGYVFGGAVSMSLQEMLEKFDSGEYTTSASDGEKTSAKNLYNTYTSVMSRWDVPNIKAAVAADKAQEEAATWKVLVLGNSHSLDATNMLYEVFQAENPDQKLVLGVLYRGGCKMDQHASYASTNTAAYTYYKNDGSAEINNDNSGWVLDADCTMLQALQDEQWDVVVLQEMNTYAGISDKFEDNDIKSVINYVKRNTAGDPKFMWNLIWTNPEIPEYDQAENAWIYKVQKPSDYDSVGTWEAWYDYFDGDSWTMYNNIVSNVATYVEGEGYNYGFEEVLTSGTAIQYAKKLLVEQGLTLEQAEKVLHRDYTHMNDYGRLIVSYLWYAQLMEYFDSENFDWSTLATEGLKYTDVPTDMLHDRLLKYAPDGMQITDGEVLLNENIGADVEVNLYQLLIDAVTYAIESDDYAVEAPQTAQ